MGRMWRGEEKKEVETTWGAVRCLLSETHSGKQGLLDRGMLTEIILGTTVSFAFGYVILGFLLACVRGSQHPAV